MKHRKPKPTKSSPPAPDRDVIERLAVKEASIAMIGYILLRLLEMKGQFTREQVVDFLRQKQNAPTPLDENKKFWKEAGKRLVVA